MKARQRVPTTGSSIGRVSSSKGHCSTVGHQAPRRPLLPAASRTAPETRYFRFPLKELTEAGPGAPNPRHAAARPCCGVDDGHGGANGDPLQSAYSVSQRCQCLLAIIECVQCALEVPRDPSQADPVGVVCLEAKLLDLLHPLAPQRIFIRLTNRPSAQLGSRPQFLTSSSTKTNTLDARHHSVNGRGRGRRERSA